MTERSLNRRLTSLDAGFLYSERPDQATHVGGCMVYEGHISQKLTYGLLVDPKLVPDLWDLADCLRASYDELRAAAEQAHAPGVAAVAS